MVIDSAFIITHRYDMCEDCDPWKTVKTESMIVLSVLFLKLSQAFPNINLHEFCYCFNHFFSVIINKHNINRLRKNEIRIAIITNSYAEWMNATIGTLAQRSSRSISFLQVSSSTSTMLICFHISVLLRLWITRVFFWKLDFEISQLRNAAAHRKANFKPIGFKCISKRCIMITKTEKHFSHLELASARAIIYNA